VNWVGYDPDGRVDHYLYTIDPQSLAPGEDTVWTETNENERRLFFQSTERFLERSGRYIGRDHHIFVIKAIDDKGQQGPHVSRAFFSYTVAPEVRITNPHPGAAPAYVTPAVRINWLGEDPDGVFTAKPVKYKYILLSASSEFPKDLAYTNPDSLRRYYVSHPLGPWAGWDSTSADTTQVQYTNLTPGSEYMFVVVAFDEAGAYSPLRDSPERSGRRSRCSTSTSITPTGRAASASVPRPRFQSRCPARSRSTSTGSPNRPRAPTSSITGGRSTSTT
jgi:hypothetical protein